VRRPSRRSTGVRLELGRASTRAVVERARAHNQRPPSIEAPHRRRSSSRKTPTLGHFSISNKLNLARRQQSSGRRAATRINGQQVPSLGSWLRARARAQVDGRPRDDVLAIDPSRLGLSAFAPSGRSLGIQINDHGRRWPTKVALKRPALIWPARRTPPVGRVGGGGGGASRPTSGNALVMADDTTALAGPARACLLGFASGRRRQIYWRRFEWNKSTCASGAGAPSPSSGGGKQARSRDGPRQIGRARG
jgi:hypothetical protein